MIKLRLIGTVSLALLYFTWVGHTATNFQAGINFNLGFPQNGFKENVDKTGFGGSLHFAYKLPKTPIYVGASIGFIVYGRETREVPFSETIPDVMVNVTNTNNILNCHFIFRLQPLKGTLSPYLDGLIGFNYLWTETSVRSHGFLSSSAIGYTQHDDLAFSYGAGGGLMIRVYSKEKKGKGPFSVYIELAARYLKGGRAEYLKEESFRQENGIIEYDVSKSNTDLVTAHIGVSFTF